VFRLRGLDHLIISSKFEIQTMLSTNVSKESVGSTNANFYVPGSTNAIEDYPCHEHLIRSVPLNDSYTHNEFRSSNKRSSIEFCPSEGSKGDRHIT